MIITTKIQTDLVLSGEIPVIEAVQDDKYSRNLEISLLSGGIPWEVPSGTAAAVLYRKPDGTGGSYDTMPDGTPACTITGNVITAALAPQVCTAYGMVRIAICLINADAQVNTFAINMIVHRNLGIDVVSEDYISMSAYVEAAGWTPNMLLGTDENGCVVAMEVPKGIDATVEDVLDALHQAASVSVVREDSTVSLTTILEDGNSSVSEVTLNSSGFPECIVTDGVECAVSWTGFEDTVLLIWEGGSY